MEEIKFYKVPFKSLRLLFLSSIFVIPSAFFIINDNQTQFWPCLAFFGISFCLSIFNILDKRVQIIFNEIGIWDRFIDKEFIKWECIEEAYYMEIHRQIFIPIKTNKSFIAKKKLYKWASLLNRKAGGQKINLNFSYLNADIEKVIEFINIMKFENIEERQKLIKMYKNRLN